MWAAGCDTIPGVGKNGQSKDNDVPPEVFARLHVPAVDAVTRSQQKRGKNLHTKNTNKLRQNETSAQWRTDLTALCCKSPSVVSSECGGMESRMVLPNSYTSAFLLRQGIMI